MSPKPAETDWRKRAKQAEAWIGRGAPHLVDYAADIRKTRPRIARDIDKLLRTPPFPPARIDPDGGFDSPDGATRSYDAVTWDAAIDAAAKEAAMASATAAKFVLALKGAAGRAEPPVSMPLLGKTMPIDAGRGLRAVRTRAGVTMGELAERLAWKVSEVSDVEVGRDDDGYRIGQMLHELAYVFFEAHERPAATTTHSMWCSLANAAPGVIGPKRDCADLPKRKPARAKARRKAR